MSESQDINWNLGEKSGRIWVESYSLWLSVHGPDKIPTKPLIIIIPGLASSTTEWTAVQRGLSPFVRVLQYQRSGYGESDTSTKPPTAVNIALELDILLRKANLQPPFLLIAHSWGGIISREFLALRVENVCGVVFVEANQEQTLNVLDWRKLAFSPLLTGIVEREGLINVKRNNLGVKEWNTYLAELDMEKHKQQAEAELAEYAESFDVLASKDQLHRNPPLLGHRPIYIIKGDTGSHFAILLDEVTTRGGGDAAQKADFQEMLTTWNQKDRALQSELSSLSSTSYYVEVANSGHDVHLTVPNCIVDGVRWVLSQIHQS